MVINSDSWHYKLISMMNRRYEGNLCSYMRALVASLCMLLLLGAILGEVILVIVLIPGIAILDFFNVPYYLGILSFLAPPQISGCRVFRAETLFCVGVRCSFSLLNHKMEEIQKGLRVL